MDAKQSSAADRARLSKDAVVDRALALADAQGLDGLTIRRLAQELGVTPMALYWHFRSKDELLGALGERVWSEIDIALDPAAPWHQQIRFLMESLVRMLRTHPAASQLLLSSEKRHGEASQRVTETALEVLRRGGFDAQTASEVARGALWTGMALVMSEPGYDPSLSDAERGEEQRQNRIRLAMLPPEKFPRLIESADYMTSCDDPDYHYDFGIELFITGVTAIASRTASESPAVSRE